MELSSPGNADTDSESESESEQEQPRKKSPVAAPKNPQPQDFYSSTERESNSESELDPATQKPNPVVKPITSKPMDDPKKAVITIAMKPRSKTEAAAKPTSPKKFTTVVGSKRLVDDGEAKESKRSKRKLEKEIENPIKKMPTEDVKRQLFQRLWSEDDEIAILKGMNDYWSKKKADPVADLSAFHEFIKKSLHVDVTKTQLQDKIRRLKKNMLRLTFLLFCRYTNVYRLYTAMEILLLLLMGNNFSCSAQNLSEMSILQHLENVVFRLLFLTIILLL